MTDSLIQLATEARTRAFAPYSKFKVGAALESDSGEVSTGCNVEAASYGLTICAERVALVKAISEGTKGFRRIAIVADTAKLTPPCGACRQMLWEHAPDAEVILANLAGETKTYTVRALLPDGFDASLFT